MKYINLLPQSKQQELYYEALFRNVKRCMAVAGLSFGLVVLGQGITWLYLHQLSASVSNKITEIKKTSNKEENNQLKAKIRVMNNQIQDFNNLSETTPKWSKVMRAFTANVPSEVKISTVTANFDNKKMDISGFSPSRDAVLVLYNNINQDSNNFYKIDYPLENVSKPTDVPFHFTFYIKDELLK